MRSFGFAQNDKWGFNGNAAALVIVVGAFRPLPLWPERIEFFVIVTGAKWSGEISPTRPPLREISIPLAAFKRRWA